jgi:hypothetical protein
MGLVGFLSKIVVINTVLKNLLALASNSGAFRMDNMSQPYLSPTDHQ